jgi:hypothetical protein
MLEHLRRRVTQYRPATPTRPAGYGAVGASAALALLPDAHGIAFVALPSICPGHPRQRVGARNVAAQRSSTTC